MRKPLIYILLFIIAFGIIIGVFGIIGFDKIWNNLRSIGWDGFGLYFLVTLLALGMTGLGWWLSLHSYGISVSFAKTAVGHLIGFGMNMLIPSMYIGGEPFRAYYIGKSYNIPKTQIFATALFAKFVELIAFLLFLYFGTIVLCCQADESAEYKLNIILIAIDVVLTVVLATLIWGIFKNIKVITRFLQFVKRLKICAKTIDKISPKVAEMEETVSHVFHTNWKTGIFVMLCSLVSVGITFLKPAIIFYFLQSKSHMLSIGELAAIFVITQILMSFHITPGGMGLVEGGNMVLFSYIGISSDIAAAYLLISRFIDFFIAGSGCYLMVHYSLVKIGGKKIIDVDEKELESLTK